MLHMVYGMNIRNPEKYFIKQGNTERYKRSSIPAMIRILHKEELKLKKAMKCVMPVPREHCHRNSISVKI